METCSWSIESKKKNLKGYWHSNNKSREKAESAEHFMEVIIWFYKKEAEITPYKGID